MGNIGRSILEISVIVKNISGYMLEHKNKYVKATQKQSLLKERPAGLFW